VDGVLGIISEVMTQREVIHMSELDKIVKDSENHEVDIQEHKNNSGFETEYN